MMISTRGRYALRVLIDLAEHDEGSFIPMKEVASRQGISLKYLEKIMPVLTQSGLVDCVHGKGGGYRLNRAPSDYVVGTILRLTEGDLSPVACLECDSSPCERSADCRTLPMWEGLYKTINEYFDGITIADLMVDKKDVSVGTVKAICISEKKGVQKHEVPEAEFVEDWGIKDDAHAGKWHRQVSLLGLEQIENFRNLGAEVSFGAFGENLIVDGFHFRKLPIGTKFKIGDVLLEMSQIGKECHSHCEIYKKMGDCIMPREGVFAKVLHGGIVKTGDIISLAD